MAERMHVLWFGLVGLGELSFWMGESLVLLVSWVEVKWRWREKGGGERDSQRSNGE